MSIKTTLSALALTAVMFFLPLTLVATSANTWAWNGKVDRDLEAALAQAATVEMIVVLSEQHDLEGAADLTDKESKGEYVVRVLRETADRTQPDLIAELHRLGASEIRSFFILNAVYARGDRAVVEALAQRPDVAFIAANSPWRLQLPPDSSAAGRVPETVEPSIDHVNADDAWALGYRGQGVVVAGADTGVMWTHEAVQAKYRGWDGATADHNYNWHDAIPVPNAICPGNSPEPCDDDEVLGGGHGTHTMGTMLGSDPDNENQIGMAPDAEWIACRNMNSGVGVPTTYLECMEWFLAPTDLNDQNPDPTKSPHVINNSWGCVEACPYPLLQPTTEAIRAAGIVYIASAGNDGPECSTIAFAPAMYDASFTVGASEMDDSMASFSSRGPVLTDASMRMKPDVVAPGVDIRSALRNGEYGPLSGTSMAGPHVAGLVALVISANPALAGNVDTIESIISSSAVDLPSDEGCGGDSPTAVPNNTFGHGRIDALAAVLAAQVPPTAVSLGAVAVEARAPSAFPLAVAAAVTLVVIAAGRRRRPG